MEHCCLLCVGNKERGSNMISYHFRGKIMLLNEMTKALFLETLCGEQDV